MNQEKLQEVFSNEDFVKELLSKETPEEVQEMLAEKEIDITIEEIKETRKILIKKAEQQTAEGEELTDDDLEDVAGGIAPLLAVALWYGACAIGFAIMFEVNSRKTGERW
jgi:lactobin A/cerein 7B family class IIb bacteriocin